MSKNTSPLRAYVDQMDDLPLDVLLGRIVLFTITEEPIRHDDIVTWFKDLGLDEAYLPTPNKYLDAFKKATSDTKETYSMAKGRTAHLLCRDVSSTPDYVRRQITREVKDSGKRKLAYHEAITCTFFRPTKATEQETAQLRITVNPTFLEPEELPNVQRIARDIVKRYDSYYAFLDGQKVRATIRGYLKKLNAIEIKGGVYFVHASRDEELGRLAQLVERFGGGCHMNMIPMVDLERERAFMAKVFEREASESLRNLTTEAKELMASRKTITPAAYSKLKARYDEVLNNATEHVETLQISQDITAAAAEVAHKTLAQLAEAMVDA